jgi:hypothetical protein
MVMLRAWAYLRVALARRQANAENWIHLGGDGLSGYDRSRIRRTLSEWAGKSYSSVPP